MNASGHSAVEVSQAAAYDIITQSLNDGMFAFCEPDNIVISSARELQGRNLNQVTIFAPVAGG